METAAARSLKEPDIRRDIMTAAHSLFAAEGYAKASMRKIATMIGYSPTTIYHYFRSKGDLFFRLTEEIHREHLERITEIRKDCPGHVEALRRVLSSYVDMGLSNPAAYKIGFMLESDIRPDPESHFPEGSCALKLYTLFRETVRGSMEALQKKNPDAGSVELAVQAVWAQVHGLTSLLVTYPTFPWGPLEALKEQVVEAAVKGLTHTPANPNAFPKTVRLAT